MRNLIRSLCLFLAMQPALVAAQQFPLTMPPNTVYGRLGIGTGPGQAIPFANLTGALLNILSGQSCASSNWVKGFGSTGSLVCAQPAFTDLTGTSGIDLNTLNAQAANYQIAPSDSGKTVSMSGGPFTVTLPSVSGFASNAQVTVCNSNLNLISTHAMRMSGFPNPILGRLYQQQCVVVAIVNGSWVAKSVPGRFRPAFTAVIYIDNGGSDSNDGLVSNAASNALLTVQKCFSIFETEYDQITTQPTCSPTGGQTFVGSFQQTGMQVGTSVFNLTGNGGVATLRPTPGASTVLSLNDFAGYIITTNVKLDCTGGASNCFTVFFHQQTGADFFAGTSFNGAGTSNTVLNCDSMCKINFNGDASSPVVISGTFGTGFSFNLGSMINFANGLTVAASTSVVGDLIFAQQNSSVQFSNSLSGGASTSVQGSVFSGKSNATFCLQGYGNSWSVAPAQKFKMLNGAVLSNVSANAIVGTAAGAVTATGFAPGFAPDGAGGNTGVNAGGC